MKISVITVTYNSEATIKNTLKSVTSQSYDDIEHIIIDGASTDNTLQILKKSKHSAVIVSEPDNGIYDALNKGIHLASGDIIGVLHSDDIFANENIVAQIAAAFNEEKFLDAVYGDVAFVSADNPERIVRYYSSASFSLKKFQFGFMPAHTSFFCRKACFDKFGYYRTDMKIAADFDLLLRFLVLHKIQCRYIPVCTTVMNTGGASTSGLKSVFTINKEFMQILKGHGFKTSMVKLYSRYFIKWREFFGN